MIATRPPGQTRIDGFPRFGTHLHLLPPAVPPDPALEVAGAASTAFEVRLEDLRALPQQATASPDGRR